MTDTARLEPADPVLCHNLRVRVRRRAGDGVLVVGLRETYFELDDIAAEVWTRLDGRTSLRSVATTIAERYGAEPDVVHDDVREVVAPLIAQDFLRGAES